jgi:Fe-S oxidoreductase
MTHLTPSIKKSMVKIFEAAGVDYTFVDEEGGVCCGRPLMLAGESKKARELINYNSKLFFETGADILVTSCPICYKVFNESYTIGMEVTHHTQFIKKLITDGSLRLNFMRRSVVYHSPCDLGRGSGVYDEPKDVLRHVARLQETGFEGANSLCCGGSLANTVIDNATKQKIARDAASELTKNAPDLLATACPLCKKTFASATETKVVDIAELVAEAIFIPPAKKTVIQLPVMRKKKADPVINKTQQRYHLEI